MYLLDDGLYLGRVLAASLAAFYLAGTGGSTHKHRTGRRFSMVID